MYFCRFALGPARRAWCAHRCRRRLSTACGQPFEFDRLCEAGDTRRYILKIGSSVSARYGSITAPQLRHRQSCPAHAARFLKSKQDGRGASQQRSIPGYASCATVRKSNGLLVFL